MPKIEKLRSYPVAGMDGFDVTELLITPEAIQGDRLFAVVLEEEFAKLLADTSYVPLRLTQIGSSGRTTLTQFRTENADGKLVISDDHESLLTGQEIVLDQSSKPFYNGESAKNLSQLLDSFAIPIQVSKKSSSKRWAVDCGDEVAKWLSERMGKRVRLVKAVRHPETKKHHFTWYTDVHAVAQSSLDELAQEAGVEIDNLIFRYNILLSGTKPFVEENWQSAILGNDSSVRSSGTEPDLEEDMQSTTLQSVSAVVSACKRCGYIGIDRTTGLLAQHIEVLHTVAKKHGVHFGVYFKPVGDSFSISLKVGDEIQVDGDSKNSHNS